MNLKKESRMLAATTKTLAYGILSKILFLESIQI